MIINAFFINSLPYFFFDTLTGKTLTGMNKCIFGSLKEALKLLRNIYSKCSGEKMGDMT
jgi:hypothetical protein